MPDVKSNKILCNEDVKVSKYFESKISVVNATLFHTLAHIFNLPGLTKTTSRYIERFFTMLVESGSLLELDFNLMTEILSSSDLHLSSEIEVFNAVRAWVNYNVEGRNEYRRDLLSKLRLHLLPENALEYVKSSSFGKMEDFAELINDVLEQNKYLTQNKSPLANRYCTQDMFNILVCYGVDLQLEDDTPLTEEEVKLALEEDNNSSQSNEVIYVQNKYSTDLFQVDGTNLNRAKVIASMPPKRSYEHACYCNGEIYFFGGCNEDGRSIRSVEKYSMLTGTCEVFTDVYDVHQNMQCACVFMNEIYLIGGNYIIGSSYDNVTNDCSKFNPKEKKFIEVAKMNSERAFAACSVFQGNIVATGGKNISWGSLRSVEVYDHFADKWTYMADMCNFRSEHSSVAVRNKLFAVGGSYGSSGEVYDSTSQRFTLLKNDIDGFGHDFDCKSISIGNKVIVISTGSTLCYDIDKETWVEEPFEITKNFNAFSCVKVPFF